MKPVMPRQARLGVCILVLDWLIVSVRWVLDWPNFVAEVPEATPLAAAIGVAAGVSLSGLLIYLIASGRRWALLISIALWLLGIALILATLVLLSPGPIEQTSLTDLLWSAVHAVMLITAYGLLLTRPSRAWFAAWRAKRQRPASWEVAW